MMKDEAYNGQPILQIIGLKHIGEIPTLRYHMVLSDGQHLQDCMLSKKLNHLVADGQLNEKAIIKVQNYKKTVVTKV